MKTPTHVAIVMDGNGRWAKNRGRSRSYGHVKGARAARKIIETCVEKKVQFLTLFAFSTENWLRPKSEVSFLMKLLGRHLQRERKFLIENNVRFTCIGDWRQVPASVAQQIEFTINETRKNTGMTLIFAVNYGARTELVRVMRILSEKVKRGEMSSNQIDELEVSRNLWTGEIPDPDLLIRTSGECRLSNFLLWQAAYAELYFTDCLWPDFSETELESAFLSYAARERRYGRLSLPNLNSTYAALNSPLVSAQSYD